MASTARIDELKKKFDENPRRYFAPLANEFRKAGDIVQSIAICEEFLPQQPGHMSGHIVYGQALYEAGRLPESRTVFETALGLDPENLIALRHLGDIAHAQGDVLSARTWYIRVLDADPRNEEIQGLIAMIPAEPEALLDDMAIIPEDDFDLALSIEAPDQENAALGASIDIEKDVPSLEAPEISLEDTHPLGIPVVPDAATPPPLPITEPFERFTLAGFHSSPEDSVEADTFAAPGFESASFEPPDEEIPAVAGLDDSLDSGVPSFEAPTQEIAPVDGLLEWRGTEEVEDEVDTLEFPAAVPLVVDDGLTLPPQGDPIAASAGLHEAEPATTAPDAGEVAEVEDLDLELPPSVIAAEAELIDEGASPPPSPVPEFESEILEPEASEAAPAAAPFVTETMAELYVAQGFHEEARAVYVQLLAASPGDTRLQALIASLAPSEPARHAEPTAREFFARMAYKRPGMRGAGSGPPLAPDVASTPEPDSAPESATVASEPTHEVAVPEPFGELVEESAQAPPASSPSDVAPALERAAAMRTPSGSIDALFGNRNPGTSEDSAASALAQAFGATAEAEPLIVGRPARTAAAELSLDSVFRDGPARPPRTSQSFSFDQFFTGGAKAPSGTAESAPGSTTPPSSKEVPTPGEPPAERSADDIQQFNSWLQGLKPR